MAGVLLALWGVAWWQQRSAWSTGLLLAAVLATGGFRQQLAEQPEPGLSIAAAAGEERKLVRLAGTLEQEPRLLRRTEEDLETAWIQPERSRCVVAVRSLEQEGRPVPVTGRSTASTVTSWPSFRASIRRWSTWATRSR